MRELGIDLAGRVPSALTDELRRAGRRRRDDGLRRRVPLHPRQALPRLGPARSRGRPIEEVRATRDEIAQRVAELIRELDA